ncbi:MAG: MmgE/PrpD family protein [Chloroflexi bacterium]|nr:MmgE/PrpD family protein [Chloroflexota bacterium]
MTLEEQLVRHLRERSFSDLPEEAVEIARREVLWTLGSCVAGAGAPGSDRIARFVRDNGGRAEATVVGFGDRVPANMAGLANGAFAKALEYEDKLWHDHVEGAFAIATAVVPAAFAMAEHSGGVDGKALLLAVTLATDIQARLVGSVPRSVFTGWNSTYMFASFGAAIAAGVLLGLTEEEFLNALGLAYAQTAGNYQGHEEEGVQGICLQMGFGVRNGITSAQLARLGVTGVKQFLTGRHGLYFLFYKGEETHMEWLTRDLGQRFYGTRLGFKGYPCGAACHAPLDAVLSLVVRDAPGPEMIESVLVYAPARVWRVVEPKEVRQNPQNEVSTLFSLPWALACAIADRRITISHFKEKALRDPRYFELARKVDVDMASDREGTSVEIKLKDGRTLRSETVLKPKGHPDNPRSMEEMLDRYWDCLQYSPRPLPREQASLAKDLVLGLEGVSDVARVIRLLC